MKKYYLWLAIGFLVVISAHLVALRFGANHKLSSGIAILASFLYGAIISVIFKWKSIQSETIFAGMFGSLIAFLILLYRDLILPTFNASSIFVGGMTAVVFLFALVALLFMIPSQFLRNKNQLVKKKAGHAYALSYLLIILLINMSY